MTQLADLYELLRDAKRAEDEARDWRLSVEAEILDHPQFRAHLDGREEGRATIEGICVSKGLTRDWDQDALTGMASKVDRAYWPFRSEWKEDRKAFKVMEERFPELAAELNQALTLKPKKTSITLK